MHDTLLDLLRCPVCGTRLSLVEHHALLRRGADGEAGIAVITQCPSGALSYSVDGVEHRDREDDPMILIAPNGPYAIFGGADLRDVTWAEGASKEHFDLCRCGHSKNKPFCDGAHRDHPFDDAPPPAD